MLEKSLENYRHLRKKEFATNLSSVKEILKDYIRKKDYVRKGKSEIKIKNKYIMKLRNA